MMQIKDQTSAKANGSDSGLPGADGPDTPSGSGLPHRPDPNEGEIIVTGPAAAAEDRPKVRVTDKRHWVEGAEPDTGEALKKPTYIETLEAKLREKDETLREYIAAHKQAEANFHEARERIRRDVDNEIERHKAFLAAGFLDVIDNLERAAQTATGPEHFDALKSGITLSIKGFVTKLGQMGVTSFDPLGEPFDPVRHEAMIATLVGPEQADKVLEVYRGGFALGDRVVRPAQVRVGRHQE